MQVLPFAAFVALVALAYASPIPQKSSEAPVETSSIAVSTSSLAASTSSMAPAGGETKSTPAKPSRKTFKPFTFKPTSSRKPFSPHTLKPLGGASKSTESTNESTMSSTTPQGSTLAGRIQRAAEEVWAQMESTTTQILGGSSTPVAPGQERLMSSSSISTPMAPGQERMISSSAIAPGQERLMSSSSIAPGQERMISSSSIAPGQERLLSSSSIAPGQERMISSSSVSTPIGQESTLSTPAQRADETTQGASVSTPVPLNNAAAAAARKKRAMPEQPWQLTDAPTTQKINEHSSTSQLPGQELSSSTVSTLSTAAIRSDEVSSLSTASSTQFSTTTGPLVRHAREMPEQPWNVDGETTVEDISEGPGWQMQTEAFTAEIETTSTEAFDFTSETTEEFPTETTDEFTSESTEFSTEFPEDTTFSTDATTEMIRERRAMPEAEWSQDGLNEVSWSQDNIKEGTWELSEDETSSSLGSTTFSTDITEATTFSTAATEMIRERRAMPEAEWSQDGLPNEASWSQDEGKLIFRKDETSSSLGSTEFPSSTSEMSSSSSISSSELPTGSTASVPLGNEEDWQPESVQMH